MEILVWLVQNIWQVLALLGSVLSVLWYVGKKIVDLDVRVSKLETSVADSEKRIEQRIEAISNELNQKFDYIKEELKVLNADIKEILKDKK